MFVRTTALEEGMVLEKDCKTMGGQVLYPCGTRLSAMDIINIGFYSIDGCYVTETLSNAVDGLTLLSAVNQCLSRIHYGEPTANSIVLYILDYIKDCKHLSHLCIYNAYTYEHCVNVFTLSMLLGIHLGLCERDLRYLAVASLCHDIGKLRIPMNILEKKEKLTEEELDIMRKHVIDSYTILKGINLEPEILDGVERHHENYDGTGYPYGFSGEEIGMIGSIIHVADVFDAYIASRPYHDSRALSDGYLFCLSQAGKMLSPVVIEALKDIITPYPVGSVLRLSNNSLVIVVANHYNDVYNPVVRNLNTKELLDLRNTKLAIEAWG